MTKLNSWAIGFTSSAVGWGCRSLPNAICTIHTVLWLLSGLRQSWLHKGRPFIPASKGLSVWQGTQHCSKQLCCPLVLGWEAKPSRNIRTPTQKNQPAILVLASFHLNELNHAKDHKNQKSLEITMRKTEKKRGTWCTKSTASCVLGHMLRPLDDHYTETFPMKSLYCRQSNKSVNRKI